MYVAAPKSCTYSTLSGSPVSSPGFQRRVVGLAPVKSSPPFGDATDGRFARPTAACARITARTCALPAPKRSVAERISAFRCAMKSDVGVRYVVSAR
jgi:hypothetical protein